MPPLILLPFGVFFVCCILQFWYLKKVRDALIERHPDTFLSVEKSSIFPMQGLFKFARGGRYKDLNDALLNRHVRNLKRLMIVAYIAWGGLRDLNVHHAVQHPTVATCARKRFLCQ